MSVGTPTIIWGDAQGYLDVVEGLWPPRSDGIREIGDGELYPKELIIGSDADVPRALRALLSNASLRVEASNKGLRLAERFQLDRIVDHLDGILVDAEIRKSAQ